MSRHSGTNAVFVLLVGFLWFAPIISGQQAKVAARPGVGSELSPEKAVTLAEQGHCRESISALKRAMAGQVPAETRKRAGIVGLRCSLTLDDRDSTMDFIRLLNKQFGRDPDVLLSLSMLTLIYRRERPRTSAAQPRNHLLLTN